MRNCDQTPPAQDWISATINGYKNEAAILKDFLDILMHKQASSYLTCLAVIPSHFQECSQPGGRGARERCEPLLGRNNAGICSSRPYSWTAPFVLNIEPGFVNSLLLKLNLYFLDR